MLDTALMLLLQDAVAAVVEHLGQAVEALARLTAEHGDTAMAGRTLTQPALPTTFGVKVAAGGPGWPRPADLEALAFPVQVGGPVGTAREGAADLAGRLGLADAPSVAHPAPAGHPGGRRAGRGHRRVRPHRP